MMVFMVRGLFTNLQYPNVQFPVRSLTGDLLFDPFWEAASRLERQGVKVQHSTCTVCVNSWLCAYVVSLILYGCV